MTDIWQHWKCWVWLMPYNGCYIDEIKFWSYVVIPQ